MDWRERFPGVDEADWRDWRWQLRHALRGADELGRLVELTGDERRGLALGGLRTAVTPYYASLMDPTHPACPVRRQAIPVGLEGEAGAAAGAEEGSASRCGSSAMVASHRAAREGPLSPS